MVCLPVELEGGAVGGDPEAARIFWRTRAFDEPTGEEARGTAELDAWPDLPLILSSICWLLVVAEMKVPAAFPAPAKRH